MSEAQNRVGELLGPLVGTDVPGGCDHCDAYQRVQPDPELDGLWHITTHHDGWCPWLQEREQKARRARSARN